MSTKKLLIVGTGITGAISAGLIKRNVNDILIVMWDKALKIGGRMNTTRNPFHPSCTADLGAQYITRYPDFMQSHAEFYEELLQANVLKPLNITIEGMKAMPHGAPNYVTPKGVSSIVDHFLQKSGVPIVLDQKLNYLAMNESGTKWLATSDTVTDTFDAVLLTMPIPQVLQTQGNIQDLLGKDEKLKRKMESVGYSSRYALALFYSRKHEFFESLPWSAKYFVDSDIVFAAIDSTKRGDKDLPSVVVHTSRSFGTENLECSKESVQEKILAILRSHLPGIPTPESIKCHRWRYSQVQNPFPGNQGCLVLHDSPLLICGGDSFTSSTFDGCIEAAKRAADEIVKYFT